MKQKEKNLIEKWSKTHLLSRTKQDRCLDLASALENQRAFNEKLQDSDNIWVFKRISIPLLVRLFNKDENIKSKLTKTKEESTKTTVKFKCESKGLDYEFQECERLEKSLLRWLKKWKRHYFVNNYTFKALELKGDTIFINGLKTIED